MLRWGRRSLFSSSFFPCVPPKTSPAVAFALLLRFLRRLPRSFALSEVRAALAAAPPPSEAAAASGAGPSESTAAEGSSTSAGAGSSVVAAAQEQEEQEEEGAADRMDDATEPERGEAATPFAGGVLHYLTAWVAQQPTAPRVLAPLEVGEGGAVRVTVRVATPERTRLAETLAAALCRASEHACAAALAARLLDAPACRAARAGDAAAVALLRDAGQACGAAGQGIWLGPRDALAVLVTGSAVQSVPDHRVFAACAADDCSAYWIDPLHGGRGVCPTTVLQWSKGTVHHATE